MKALYRLIKVLDDNLKTKSFKDPQKRGKLSKFLSEILQRIVSSLTEINTVSPTAMGLILEDEKKNEMICLQLKMIKVLLKVDLLYDDFTSQCLNIYHNCLLPLLVSRENELQLAESEPVEFVNLTFDLVDK